jgi:hypothetical protein
MQQRIPAWLLSLALHLVILLAGALLVRATSQPSTMDEPPRAGAVVLAPASDLQRIEYYDEADVSDTSAAMAIERVSTASASIGDRDPPTASISLPQAPGPVPGAELLAVGPIMPPGRGQGRMSRMSAEEVAAILAEEAARAKPAGPTGPKAKLSLFGSGEAQGRSFVFLIDRSQSMGHRGLGAIAAAAKELAASIDRLGPEQKFQVIAYNQKAESLGGRELLPATPENKRRLIEFVSSTVAVGATEHEMGLFAALRHKPDVIFLLTDAGDPGLKPGQLRAIHESAAGRTAIHCLHFGAGPLSADNNFMEQLAADNGGSYVYIDMRERE